MNKPAIITTNKPLPFAELSPAEFERMCMWLVDREGYERPQHLGEAGGEQGRDIVAYKLTRTGEETWFFQCKRRNRITSTAFEKEVDKYNQLTNGAPEKRPKGIVFVTNAAVSARTRDRVDAYCRLFGYECEFWARTELDLRVKKHNDIVKEFFYSFVDSGFQNSLTTCVPAVLRMVEDYSVVFGGRDSEIAELNRFLNTDLPCALIIAPTGRGKTALLIHWIDGISLSDEWFVVFHPISQRYQTATADATLSSLLSGLAEFYGLNISSYSNSPDQLRFLVNDLLRREPPNERKLLVVLDGLDETIGWQIDRTLFPRELPRHVKLVVSVREIALRKPEGWLDQLGWSRSKTSVMRLDLLNRSSVSDLLKKSAAFKKTVSNEDLVSQLLRVSEGDPLTIRYIVEGLQSAELTLEKLSNVPPGLEAFIDYWIRELEPTISKDLVAYSFLGLLGAAVAPLANADLENLVPEMFSRSVVVRDVVRSVERFVVGDGSNANGYVLSHPRLREIFFERVSPSEQRTFRQRFVEYGLRSWRERSNKLPSYVRLHWIKQLAEASEWNLMREILTEFELDQETPRQPWCHIRFKNEGSYAGYLSDLSLLWGEAEKRSNLFLVTRCALIFSSIRSLSGNFAPELIADLVAVGSSEGRWPFSAGIEYIRQIPDSQIQVLALVELYRQSPDLPAELAFSLIEAIRDDRSRARALEGIGPFVDQRLTHQMMTIVQNIHEPYARSIALCTLASRLPKEQKFKALDEAEKLAHTIPERTLHVAALAQIAIQHPKKSKLSIWKHALDDATEIEGVADRWHSLSALGPNLPKRLMPKFLKSVRSLEIDGRKADIFSEMLDRLPPEVHDEVWETTITRLSEPVVFTRCQIGVKLAESNISLSPHVRERLVPIARSIEEPQGRARALAALASRITDESQRTIWSEVIEATRVVEHPEMPAETSLKAGTWLDTLPLMPADLAADVWTEALDSTLGMFNDHHGLNYDLFCDLVKFLPSDFLPLALDSARKGEIKPMLAKRLVNIGRRFGGTKQKALLAEAVLAAQELEDSRAVAEAIGSIGPHLDSDSALRRIEVARAIADDLSRFTALQGLAQSLHNEDGVLIWQEALSLIRAEHSGRHDWANWRALSGVICRVPDELLLRLLEIGLSMRHSEARARTLAEIAKRFSGTQASTIWQQVLNASASSVSSLGLALSNLQPRLAPDIQLQQWKSFLGLSIAIKDDYTRNLAIKGLAPYVPSSLSSALMDFTDQMGQTLELDRIDILVSLVPNLSEELFPRFISIAHESSNSWAVARLLGALSSRFSNNQKDALLDEALRNLENSDSDFDRSYGLEEIAPNLSNSLAPRALAIARSITDPSLRAQALIAFGNTLPSEAIGEALHSASLTTEWSARVRLLGEVATLLAATSHTSPRLAKDSRQLWAETIRLVSLYGRNDLLQGISALVPWLATFATSQDFGQIFDDILDTRCSWS